MRAWTLAGILLLAGSAGATSDCTATGGFDLAVPGTDVVVIVYQGSYPASIIVDLGNDNDVCSDQTLDSLRDALP